MTTTKKPAIKPSAKAAVKTPTRGGKRPNAGRQAADGATRILTTSIGFMQHHLDFLDRKPQSRSVYMRKIVDALIARESKKS